MDPTIDANVLLDIDLKCFENPWTAETWGKLVSSKLYGIAAVRHDTTPVGCGVFHRVNNSMVLLKLCVKPQYRLKGYATNLLHLIFDRAKSMALDDVSIVIPESMVYPGPHNASKFLTHVGFTPVQPFLKNHFTFYGTAEDGVNFVAPASIRLTEIV